MKKSPGVPLTDEEFKRRLLEKYGPCFWIKSKYISESTKILLKCKRCKDIAEVTPKALQNKHRKNLCLVCSSKRCSTPEYKKLLNMGNVQEEMIKYLYDYLCFTPGQIRHLTGVTAKFIKKILRESGLLVSSGTSGRFRTELRNIQKGLVPSKRVFYYKSIYLITRLIYKKYKNILNPKNFPLGLGEGKYNIDHKYSKNRALLREKGPLNLKILCHPANLEIIPSIENVSKGKKCSVTLKQLKKDIKSFEDTNGKVEFPKNYEYNFKNTESRIEKVPGLIVLGVDPGSKNYGFFIGKLVGTSELLRVEIFETGLLKHPITTLNEDMSVEGSALDLFQQELLNLVVKHKPDVVVSERFQARGFGASLIEMVTWMNSSLTTLVYYHCENLFERRPQLKTIIAASWKNKINKIVDLKELYKEYSVIEPHRIDACLIAISQFPSHLKYKKIKGADNPFSFLADKEKRDKLFFSLQTNTYNSSLELAQIAQNNKPKKKPKKKRKSAAKV